LCDFPQGVFAMALQTAALPSLSSWVARRDDDAFARTFSYAMRLSLFVAIPVSCVLVFLAEPLVIAFFQRGQFHPHDAAQTASALAWQGSAVWCVAAVRQLVPTFFATGDTRTPVLVSLVDLGALLGLAFVFTPSLGHVGVSVAVAGSSLVQMLGLWGLAWYRLPSLRAHGIAPAVMKVLGASLLAGLVGRGVATSIRPLLVAGPWQNLVPGLAGVVSFALTFLAGALIFRCEELATLRISRRVRKASTHGK